MSSLEPLVPFTAIEEEKPKQEKRCFEKEQILSFIAMQDPSFKTVDLTSRPKLNLLNDKQWQLFCNTIATLPALDELSLTFCSFGELSALRWKQFCDAIAANSSLKHLDLSNFNSLNKLDPNQWKQLSDAIIANGNLSSLNLGSNYLEMMTGESWIAFCKHIVANPKVVNLNLSWNTLGSLDIIRWSQFCEAIIANRNLLGLNLGLNSLAGMSLDHWSRFFEAIIANTKVSELNLSNNNLATLKDDFWHRFRSTLMSSNISTLCLANNYLYILNDLSWTLFCDAIKNSPKLTTLNLVGNQINKIRGLDRWVKFCEAFIANRHLESLDLSSNYLASIDSPTWKYLCETIIAKSSLTHLNLDPHNDQFFVRGYNGQSVLDSERLENFCSALAANKRINVELWYSYLPAEEVSRIQKLLDANKKYREESSAPILKLAKEVASTDKSDKSDEPDYEFVEFSEVVPEIPALKRELIAVQIAATAARTITTPVAEAATIDTVPGTPILTQFAREEQQKDAAVARVMSLGSSKQ